MHTVSERPPKRLVNEEDMIQQGYGLEESAAMQAGTSAKQHANKPKYTKQKNSIERGRELHI